MTNDVQPFASATAKLRQGNKHAAETYRLIKEYVDSRPWQPEVDGRYSQHAAGLSWKVPIPEAIMLAAGDALHNFRSALDHCVWELWEAHDSQLPEHKIGFPFCDAEGNFKKKIDALLPANEGDKRLLEQFETHPEGNGQDLYQLNKLDNIDKHRFINLALASVRVSGLKEGFYNHAIGAMVYSELPPVELSITSEIKGDFGMGTIQGPVLAFANIGYRDAGDGPPFDFSGAVGEVRLRFTEHAPYPAEDIISTLDELGERVGFAIASFSHYRETGEVWCLPPPRDRL